jgi:ankyrin repeat protein
MASPFKRTLPPHERLHAAMMRGDAPTVRALLLQHPEFRPLINAPLFPFNAPAIVACAGSAAMVDVLLEFGADPNARSAWWAGGFHALHSATGDAAARLLAAGAIPDACAAAHLDEPAMLQSLLAQDAARVSERGGDGQTPLHFARSKRVIDMLLDAGADIDARDVDHRATPAEWMIDRSQDSARYELAAYLVDRGATMDIFLASALGRTESVTAMLQRDPELLNAQTGRGHYGEAPPSSQHIYYWTIGRDRGPLETAAQFGHGDTVAAMLPFASPVQRLRLCCRQADQAGARELLRAYPTLVTSLEGDDRRMLTDAAWDADAPAVSLMMSLGFDPSVPGQDRGTALHCAAWQGSAASVAAILAHPAGRALLSVPDGHHGQPPMGWCCHGSLHGPSTGDFGGVARLLLQHGAEVGEFEASEHVEAVLAEWTPP